MANGERNAGEVPAAATGAAAWRPGRGGRPAGLRVFLLAAVLAAVTVAVLLPVTDNGFVGFDDDEYILDNPWVLGGVSWKGVVWAFTSVERAGNWHPLTWLSHMLDATLFGTAPGGHHAVSLGLHAASAALLLWVLAAMTGSLRVGAVTAALFALHPLHVESVAWAAERKDVLSGLFWMLTLACYLRYVRKPGRVRYLAVVGVFAAGLMAKPMLVTLPLVLLLLDYWPLHRFRRSGAAREAPLPRLGRLVGEKIPLFALAAASSAVTVLAQHRGDALVSLERYPLPTRLCTALTSCVAYLGRTVVPTDLAFFYPRPAGLPLWQCALAGLLLAAVTAGVLRARRGRPALAVGWLWYLLTLVPVSGLIQVGEQARADRYTYLPLIGIFLAAAWALGRLPLRPAAAAAAALALLAGLATGARAQAAVWRDEITLFTHALRVTSGNWAAEYNLGVSLAEQGRHREAVEHYREALRLVPHYAEAYNGLGISLLRLGRADEAAGNLDRAVALKPRFFQALRMRAAAAQALGRHEEAVRFYRKALSLDASDPRVHYALAVELTLAGRAGEARPHLREAARLQGAAR